MRDQQLIETVISPDAARPDRIDPAESLMMRLLVLLAAPFWVGLIGAASLSRVVRGKFPIIVLHERIGFGWKQLWVPKIATASVSGNERRLGGLVEVATGPPVELEVDGSVERWLRRTGADEIPQLLLVVAGSMRLVGPRPVTEPELREMAAAGDAVGIDFLQPGLIGLWQVLDRHGYELDERRDLDIAMIDNWSPRVRRRLLILSLRQAIGRLTAR